MTHVTRYAGTARERLIQATAATSDANGMATFRVGPCPLGYVWQGSVTITNAPSGALFNASVASTPWGQWAGPTNFGPVQLWGNETLVVVAVGLQKLTQYSMLFVGVSLPEDQAEPLPPVAPLSTVSVETSTRLINGGTVTGGAGSVTFMVPTLTRRVTVVVSPGAGANLLVALLGTTSGANYGSGSFTDVDGPDVFYFAIEPSIDPSYTLSFSGSGAAVYWVTANTTSPLVTTEANQPLVIDQPVQVYGVFGAAVDVAPAYGQFDQAWNLGLAPSLNNVVVAAPGVGQSIYVQSISLWNNGLAAAAVAEGTFFCSAGNIADIILIGGAVLSGQATFPGGFMLPSNDPLLLNVFINNIFSGGTYTIAPTL